MLRLFDCRGGGFIIVCSGLLNWLLILARSSLSITKNGYKGVPKAQPRAILSSYKVLFRLTLVSVRAFRYSLLSSA